MADSLAYQSGINCQLSASGAGHVLRHGAGRRGDAHQLVPWIYVTYTNSYSHSGRNETFTC
jgi:hypothetical protein